MGYNASAWLRNRHLLSSGGFGLVYERHAFFLFATAALAASRRLPLVVEVNELAGDARIRKQPALMALVRWCDRYTFRRAACIIVVSPHLKRRIEALGIDRSKIHLLPNAVDADLHSHLADGAVLRQKWRALPGDVVIGFAGWFVEWHKLDLFLDVFAGLVKRHPEARLVLVGEGPLEAGLRQQAERLGLGERVVFAGTASHAEMPQHLAAMDVCVVPHSNEYRSPIKLFEYMAQGRAVVVPRTEPIEMVIQDAENGLLFEPGAPASMQAALEACVADRSLRLRLGTNARRLVLERHTWDRNAQTVMAAVGHMVARD